MTGTKKVTLNYHGHVDDASQVHIRYIPVSKEIKFRKFFHG